MEKSKKTKVKVVSEASKEMFDRMKEETSIQQMMVAFAKLKVTEALQETSKHFKNPDNVYYIQNHFSLDKIV